MQRAPPNPREASHVTTVEADDVGTITLLVFDDPDSRVVVDAGSDTWEFAVNDEIAYGRWEISELPEWIEPALSKIGIRAIRIEEDA